MVLQSGWASTNRCHLARPAVVSSRLFQFIFVSFGSPSLNTTRFSSSNRSAAYFSRRACSAAACAFFVTRGAFRGKDEIEGMPPAVRSVRDEGVTAGGRTTKLSSETKSTNSAPKLLLWVTGILWCLKAVVFTFGNEGGRRIGLRAVLGSLLADWNNLVESLCT